MTQRSHYFLFTVLTVAMLLSDLHAAVGAAQDTAVQDRGRNRTESSSSSKNESKPFLTSQDDGQSGSETISKPAGKPKSRSQGGNVVRLTGPDGKTIALPKDATLQEFLEWLERRGGPEYAINSVVLTGTADDKRATLTATITIQILRDDEWVRVPLFLNEAQLVDTKHTFPGESSGSEGTTKRSVKGSLKGRNRAMAAFSDTTREGGYRWWFRGKGYHRLRISLVVPVTKMVAHRRLRLKLPPLSAVSTLDLRVSDPNLLVVPLKTADARVTRIGRKGSRIRVVGLGSELDLQWRSIPKNKGRSPILQSQTSVLIDFAEDSVVLTARQRVQVLNGSVSQVDVKLPAGYRLVAATGTHVKNYLIGAGNRVRVDFTEPRSDWTEIRWTLHRSFKAGMGKLTLDGFEVDRAKAQSGDIAIAKVQGLRVQKLDSADNHAVYRIRASRFSSPEMIRDKAISSTFHFLKQPFRLDLKVSKVQPHITVDPTIRLRFSKGKIVLNAEFRVRVSDDGGTVRNLEIDWPGWKTAGWKIQPLSASTLIEKRLLDNRNDSAPIRLELSGSHSGEILIPLSAERVVDSGQKGFSFRIPMLKADVQRPTTMTVSREPNLELDLTDRNELPLTETDSQPVDRLVRRYRIADPAVSLFTARLKAHPQRLRATTSVRLVPKPFGAELQQRIRLQVDYVPLTSVIFDIPLELVGRQVEFLNENRQRLTTYPVTSKSGRLQVEVRLQEPKLGALQFIAVAVLQLPKELKPGESGSLRVPLVQVADTKFSQVRVVAADSKMELLLPTQDWRRIPTLDGTSAWSNKSPQTSFSVRLRNPAVPHSRPFSLSKSLLRAAVDSGGTVRYRAQYQVGGDPGEIVVVLPPGTEFESVFWGRDEVREVTVSERSLLSGTTIRIPAPANSTDKENRDRLLTIDYHSLQPIESGWLTTYVFTAPRFPKNVWIEETAWQVILPRNRHLSSYSAEYFPEFRWARTYVFWSRVSTEEFEQPETWIHSAAGPVWSASSEGNVYCFRRYGPAGEIEIGAMSRPLIVLVGAGLAWLLGILLVKLPRLRTLAVLFSAALAAAVTGLWFTTELLLLLQPALLGAALASGIVGIDRLVKRRRVPAVITVADPSEFITGSRSSFTARPLSAASVGSEEPTVIRQPAAPLEPVSTQSEMRRPG